MRDRPCELGEDAESLSGFLAESSTIDGMPLYVARQAIEMILEVKDGRRMTSDLRLPRSGTQCTHVTVLAVKFSWSLLSLLATPYKLSWTTRRATASGHMYG